MIKDRKKFIENVLKEERIPSNCLGCIFYLVPPKDQLVFCILLRKTCRVYFPICTLLDFERKLFEEY